MGKREKRTQLLFDREKKDTFVSRGEWITTVSLLWLAVLCLIPSLTVCQRMCHKMLRFFSSLNQPPLSVFLEITFLVLQWAIHDSSCWFPAVHVMVVVYRSIRSCVHSFLSFFFFLFFVAWLQATTCTSMPALNNPVPKAILWQDWSVLRSPPRRLSASPFTTISMATTLGPWTSTWWQERLWLPVTLQCGRRVWIWGIVGFLAWPRFRHQVHTRWVWFLRGLTEATWYHRRLSLDDSFLTSWPKQLWGASKIKRWRNVMDAPCNLSRYYDLLDKFWLQRITSSNSEQVLYCQREAKPNIDQWYGCGCIVVEDLDVTSQMKDG